MNDKNLPSSGGAPKFDRAISDAMEKKIESVFSTLKNFYTQYYLVIKSDKQEVQMMRQWAVELLRGNVNEEMLRNGMSRAKTHAFEDSFCKWPSIGDFISWCHGMPEPSDAYREASKNCHDMTRWEPSHPAVALVFELIVRTDWRKLDDKQAKADYIRAYGKIRARVLTGEHLQYEKPEAPKRIEYSRTPEKTEQGKQSLSKLKTMLGNDEAKSDKPEHTSIENIEEKRAAALAKAREYMKQKDGSNEPK